LDFEELFIVVGSDVVVNASSYKTPATKGSIHNFNHIIFRRAGVLENRCDEKKLEESLEKIQGDMVSLKLPIHLEDISSSLIRENIDYNRDISNLIDKAAQNFIYDNSLYLREPQYKAVMETKGIYTEENKIEANTLGEIDSLLFQRNPKLAALTEYLAREDTNGVVVRDEERENRPIAVGAYNSINKADLLNEFKDPGISAYIRENATGKIASIGCLYSEENGGMSNLPQLLLTEILALCLRNDFGYAVFHQKQGLTIPTETIRVLERQGFQKVSINGIDIFAADMTSPICLTQNMYTTIKDPFNRNEHIAGIMDKAHENLQIALTRLYPGNLVISFNAGILHHKLVKMITEENGVPARQTPERHFGPYMCVPFGKILRMAVVPNTVTKTLHTDKVFEPDIKGFKIAEYPNYSPLQNQIRTIKSFERDVILVDDLLHKGYRIKELDPLFKAERVNIRKLIVGILSGKGKDLMAIQKRKVSSAYFIPNLRAWFVESSIYPFIGGDSVSRKHADNVSIIPSVNLIQPYVSPVFLNGAHKEAIYEFSMTCLDNAFGILKALEEEYQKLYGRNLTITRLGEVVISSRSPDYGDCLHYDLNLAPSAYVANDIEQLKRLRNSLVK
jgi:hypothetical protein